MVIGREMEDWRCSCEEVVVDGCMSKGADDDGDDIWGRGR